MVYRCSQLNERRQRSSLVFVQIIGIRRIPLCLLSSLHISQNHAVIRARYILLLLSFEITLGVLIVYSNLENSNEL